MDELEGVTILHHGSQYNKKGNMYVGIKIPKPANNLKKIKTQKSAGLEKTCIVLF